MVSILFGFALGTAAGLANFGILIWMTKRIGRMEPKKAGVFAIGGFLIRTAVYIGLVAAALYVKQINVFATGAGLVAASFLNLRWRNKLIQ